MGVPPAQLSSILFYVWVFHEININKPSSYWGTLILGTLHIKAHHLQLAKNGCHPWEQGAKAGSRCQCTLRPENTAGWCYTYPPEKYESQLGLLFPIYGKIINVKMFETTNQIVFFLFAIVCHSLMMSRAQACHHSTCCSISSPFLRTLIKVISPFLG